MLSNYLPISNTKTLVLSNEIKQKQNKCNYNTTNNTFSYIEYKIVVDYNSSSTSLISC